MLREDMFVVGIGASAGGHAALQEFFEHLPKDLPAAFVVVTHLLRAHNSRLDKILSAHTKMNVTKLTRITALQAGEVYVLPENAFVKLKKGFLLLQERGIDKIRNNAIDLFFKSLAEEKKEKSVGVILSGMGSDGAEGALTIFEHGGDVLVQEPSTAQFTSMPWAAIIKDHPDYILPPSKLAEKLASILREKHVKRYAQ